MAKTRRLNIRVTEEENAQLQDLRGLWFMRTDSDVIRFLIRRAHKSNKAGLSKLRALKSRKKS